jgi:hypothetical protein
MKWRLFASVAFLSLALPVIAQQSQMEEYLNTGSDAERVQKLISLGVKPESAEFTSGDEVKWRVIRSESSQEMALLFAPCGAVYASFLFLLKNTDHGWRVVDDVGFDCHYDNNVSFEVASLRRPNVDDVLVHHECEEHGTGFVKQDFNVFAIVSSKFKLVLNTEEIVNASGWPGGGELDQQSVFVTMPTTGAGSGIIEETRNSKENGNLTVEKRNFRWSQMRFRFTPSRFVKVKQPAA